MEIELLHYLERCAVVGAVVVVGIFEVSPFQPGHLGHLQTTPMGIAIARRISTRINGNQCYYEVKFRIFFAKYRKIRDILYSRTTYTFLIRNDVLMILIGEAFRGS